MIASIAASRAAASVQRHTRFFSSTVHKLSTLPSVPIFQALSQHSPSTAIIDKTGEYTYSSLLSATSQFRQILSQANSRYPGRSSSLAGQRIAFSYDPADPIGYTSTLLAILACDAIAVPISPTAASEEVRYVLDHSAAKFVVAREGKLLDKLGSVADKAVTVPIQHNMSISDEEVTLESSDNQHAAMMLYTSGTTSRPKGVILPQSSLLAQAISLQQAWQYSPEDRLLHVLPLHHIHGIVNGLIAPLLAGSSIEFASPFEPNQVWERFAAPFKQTDSKSEQTPVSIFTAVPTIYSRLLGTFPSLSAETQEAAKTGISTDHLRLCMSGSAALPTPIMEAWSRLSSGNELLERYGMTEIGMALSCGLAKSNRVPGSVGWPLPGVKVRLVDEAGNVIRPNEEICPDGRERIGEIQVAGPTIFSQYFRNPEATEKEFVREDHPGGPTMWFKTGDVALRRPLDETVDFRAGEVLDMKEAVTEDSDAQWMNGKLYYIQGRMSADIIKTGGEKVSALEIEREMLALPQIAECAVIPLPSRRWGQCVAAVVALTDPGKPMSILELRRALRSRLSPHKLPVELKIVSEIKRNAMGKVNKKDLAKAEFPGVELS